MKLVYASRKGHVEELVKKLNYPDVLKIETGEEVVNEDYFLITYTDGKGILPPVVETFVRNNLEGLKKAAVSGNMEKHADTFCFAADRLLEIKNIEIVARFDSAGDDATVELIKNALR